MANTAMNKMYCLLGAGALALAALPATAGSISDRLTVYWPDGSVYASVWVDEVNEDPNQFYFINDERLMEKLIDINQFGNATALIEPGGDPTNGPFSDIFGIFSDLTSHFFLGFQSDGDPGVQFGPDDAAIFLPEVDGASYDATMYLNPGLQVLGYKATFEVGNIPEPGSLALLGLGTLALSAYCRTVRRT